MNTHLKSNTGQAGARLLAGASLLATLLCPAALCAAPAAGHLVIAGGAIDPKDEPVYRRILQLGGQNATIGVIPTASGVPQESGPGTVEDFEKFAPKGTASVIDITTTHAERARDPKYAADIARHRILYFTGGVQSRIVDVFRAGGSDTPAYRAIVDVLTSGGVVGGTSAGAAMMSDPMIAWGNSEEALTMGLTAKEDAGLSIAKGMGLFPFGLTDQHFLRRGRLGRLVVALEETKLPRGYGVDESCAIHADLASGLIEVIGHRGLLVVDIAKAEREGQARRNIRLSLLSTGDTVDGRTGKATAGAPRKPVATVAVAPTDQAKLKDAAWKAEVISGMVAALAGAPAAAIRTNDRNFDLVISRDAQTRVFAGDTGSDITVLDARLDILPRKPANEDAQTSVSQDAERPR